MKLSIIIPVYNVEQYLHKCIDSILIQKGKSYEIILVDDGSKDSSGIICDEYASKYDYVSVFHTENKGASHARNVGIEHAQGEWISFVDADDWVSDNYLSCLPDTEGEDIIFFAANQIYDSGDIICRYPHVVNYTDRESIENTLFRLKYKNLGDIFGWTWDKFLKKSIIDKFHVRFVEDIVFREDEIFTMDYCKHINSIKVIDTPLYYYRVRKGGLTANGMLESDYLNLADNIERNLPFFTNEEFLLKEKQRLADYHVEAFTRKARIWNMWGVMDEVYSFFKRKPEFRVYATDQQVIKMLNHGKLTSYLLLMLWHGLDTAKMKLS